jgi:tRNA 2-selenouridine synthase
MAEAGQVLERRPRVLVDLRSPGEFREDHLPGARNVPLFDDDDRAVIGLLYARRSPEAAFEEGRQRTALRIGDFTSCLAAIAGWTVTETDLVRRVERMCADGIARLEQELAPEPALPGPDSVVLYCWRGGLRSRAVIAFLRELGLGEVLGIRGGYRAYRACVRARIAAWQAPPGFVLRGLTGVGKTLVLRELERLRPGWTLDLEAEAGHRSSILGAVGLQPASQKLFESRLAARFARGFPGVCVVEGESRKIGDLVSPEPVWRAIDGGASLELRAPLERRIRVLVEDYLVTPANAAELARRLPFLERRLGPRWDGVLVSLLESGRAEELVQLLLERYYDPLYARSEGRRRHVAQFDSTAPTAAAREIASWIDMRLDRRGGGFPAVGAAGANPVRLAGL